MNPMPTTHTPLEAAPPDRMFHGRTSVPRLQGHRVLARALLSIALLPAIVHVGPAGAQVRYHLTKLASLGGTSSAGNSINHRGWIAGRSNLPDNQARHATFEAVPVGAHATTASPRIKRSDETAVRLTGSVEPHLHAQAAAD